VFCIAVASWARLLLSELDGSESVCKNKSDGGSVDSLEDEKCVADEPKSGLVAVQSTDVVGGSTMVVDLPAEMGGREIGGEGGREIRIAVEGGVGVDSV
jgi:hypothetical protein